MAQLKDYPYQPQMKTEWCWCATAASIAEWYRRSNAWSQCRIAGRVFDDETCCNPDPGGSICNKPAALDDALHCLKHLKDTLDGALAFDEVVKEIDNERPIGVRIRWNDAPGAGHFLAISGYDRVMQTVTVEDPKFGKQQYAFEDLKDDYLGRGSWSFTYLTKRQPDGS